MHIHNPKRVAALMLLIVGVSFVTGTIIGAQEKVARATGESASTITLSLDPTEKPQNVDFKQFWRAWNLLDQNFIQTHSSGTIPTYEERMYGAIAGLTDSFGDPYTVFMPPADAETFNQNIQGEFGGVGMELGQKDGKLIVVAPLKNSPAEKAGVLSGDYVIGIDDKPTDGMNVDDAVSKIRGQKGTKVKLTLVREGTTDPIEISIVRDTIQIPIIKNYTRLDGVYVIELYSFSANSADLFRAALRDFIQSGSKKLLIDLRGNPGGYLESAVQMASYFLPPGDVVVTEDYKGKQDNVYHRSIGYNAFAGKQMTVVVLVDQGSASASEILAGALQQHNVAKLVGTRTFGKGSVQQLIDLGNGAEIKITVARWLTPNGSSISDGGLTPDVKVERTIEDVKAKKDPQLDAAVNYLLSH